MWGRNEPHQRCHFRSASPQPTQQLSPEGLVNPAEARRISQLGPAHIELNKWLFFFKSLFLGAVYYTVKADMICLCFRVLCK